MRNFFVIKSKCLNLQGIFYKTGKRLSFIYLCCLFALTYRFVCNEFYAQMLRDTEVSHVEDEIVFPMGKIVGIYTECEGVFVIDTCEIECTDGEFVNPVENMLHTGDYILQVNGMELSEKEVLVDAVNNCNGKELKLTVLRGENVFLTDVTPVLGKNGKYMLGVWVKDDLAGVGTITYYTEEGDFAALGHGMGDGVTNELFVVRGGDIYHSEIVGIEKGKKGDPGEVKGIIYYGVKNHLGELDTNCGKGIYGTLDEEELKKYIEKGNAYKVGKKQEIEVGKAQIISDISGKKQFYDIEITYVDYLATNSNKGLHIEIIDSELLNITGGIVQGMSGSPIIQNGKVIGAVTHVLINDPTKGYGIFIEEMIP